MRIRWWVLGIVAIGAFFGGGFLLRRGLRQGSTSAAPVGSQLFAEVLRHIRSHAVDSLAEAELYRLAASGVLEELDDPYAALVSTQRVPGAAPAGFPPPLGLYLDLVDGVVTVVTTSPGSPAERAGIRGGDRVIRIDDSSTVGLRPEAVSQRLGGRPGTTVRLRVRRADAGGALTFRLVQGPLPQLPPAESRLLSGGIGHVRAYALSAASATQVRAAVEELSRRGMRALVLDLRSCVEGRLEDALALADLFLGPGSTILISRGRMATASRTYVDSVPEPHPGLPLIVLVDSGTSGAAEVVAGALQDADRALILGETTFGRGAGQTQFPLSDALALRLSTSLWVTPSGRVIQRASLAGGVDGSDSTGARPEFRTVGGRPVRGGGGIVPDRLVLAPRDSTGGRDPILETAQELLARTSSLQALLARAQNN